MGKFDRLIRGILRDIEVELKDEFDQNFDREAYFTTAWQRRVSPIKPGRKLLRDSGDLRRSVKSEVRARSVVFTSDLPYSETQNEGEVIRVTEKMKRFFWAKHYEAAGKFGRRKDGSLRRDKRTTRLLTEAEFWKAMALKKIGSFISIPKRQFMGLSPEVEKAVREIVEENLEEFFDREFGNGAMGS